MGDASTPKIIATRGGREKERSNLIIGLVFVSIMFLQSALPRFSLMTPYGAYTAYHEGTVGVINGNNPYPTPAWLASPVLTVVDRFSYSPTFALFFLPFSHFNNAVGVFAWMLLSTVLFWYGTVFLLSKADARGSLIQGKWLLLGAVMMFNETYLSIICLQVNAIIAGMVLFGVGLYFSQRHTAAAFLLAFATNFKIFPVAVALLLALSLNWRFIGWYLGFLAASFVLPLLVIDGAYYLELMQSWRYFIINDTGSAWRFLSLQPSLEFFGVHVPDRLFLIFTLANALAIAAVAYLVFAKNRNAFIGVVMPLALCFMWLFNKRADNATIVVALPVLVLMLHMFLEARERGESKAAWFHLASMLMAWWVLSLSYSDITPKPLRELAHQYRFMFWGVMLMYCWGWGNALYFARSAIFGGTAFPVPSKSATSP